MKGVEEAAGSRKGGRAAKVRNAHMLARSHKGA